MSAKTMAEVLMVHFPNAESGYPGDKYSIFCDATGCDFASKLDHYGAAMSAFIAHQAAALSAAGFGLVADAKAEAWDEAYKLGVDDERTSQANPGIAGCFCHGSPCHCFIAPARVNPYRATP